MATLSVVRSERNVDSNYMDIRVSAMLTRIIWIFAIISVAKASLESMGEEEKLNPVQDALDSGLADLVKSISSIQDHLRNIKMPTANFTSLVVSAEINKESKSTSNETSYDKLMDKIKLAKDKIKEIRLKVGSTFADLEQNWPPVNITRHHP